MAALLRRTHDEALREFSIERNERFGETTWDIQARKLIDQNVRFVDFCKRCGDCPERVLE